MWFATEMVMHFVSFPALTEGERIGGLAPIDASRILRGPGEAVQAAPIAGLERIRLLERGDGPIYIMAGTSALAAVHADDLSKANVVSGHVALRIAVDHARRRGLTSDMQLLLN